MGFIRHCFTPLCYFMKNNNTTYIVLYSLIWGYDDVSELATFLYIKKRHQAKLNNFVDIGNKK